MPGAGLLEAPLSCRNSRRQSPGVRPDRLLVPLARDLAEFGIRCGRLGEDGLVFGEWSSDDWETGASASPSRGDHRRTAGRHDLSRRARQLREPADL
jgi:hypothetical protein